MDKQELLQNAERYCELLIVYEDMIKVAKSVTKKIAETRKEIGFLEDVLQKNGVKIKDTEVNK